MKFLRAIAAGPLWSDLASGICSSLHFETSLPMLDRAFLSKGKTGRYYYSISRNGLVLLASVLDVARIAGIRARLRVAIWHRAALPGRRPVPYGILLVIDRPKAIASQLDSVSANLPDFPLQFLAASLRSSRDSNARLSIELGGERFLNFS